MKRCIFIVSFLALLLKESLAVNCPLIPCISQPIEAEARANMAIKSAYNIYKAVLTALNTSYIEQVALLSEQILLLRQYEALLKESVLRDEEIIFLMEQANRLKANEITQRSLK